MATETENIEFSARLSFSRNNLNRKILPNGGSKSSWHFPGRMSKGGSTMSEDVHAKVISLERPMNREIDDASNSSDLNQLMDDEVIARMEKEEKEEGQEKKEQEEEKEKSKQIVQRSKVRHEKRNVVQDDRTIHVESRFEGRTDSNEPASVSSNDGRTHMTWDEVMREAELLGVPLRRSRLRLDCDRPSYSLHSRSPPRREVKEREKQEEKRRRATSKSSTSSSSSCLRKGALSNLWSWIDKLSLSSKESGVKRQQKQHTSYSPDHRGPAPPSAPTAPLPPLQNASSSTIRCLPSQRRSLSASSTFRRSSNRGGNQKPLSLSSPSPTSSLRKTSCLSPDICASSSQDNKNRNISNNKNSSKSYNKSSSKSSSSLLSTSMVVSPSSGSLCSVFSRSSRESIHGELSTESLLPSSSPVHLFRSRSPSEAHTSSSSSSIRKFGSQQLTGSGGNEQQSNMDQLRRCRWYWGPLDWEASVRILSDVPDGTFLLRDSQDDRFLFSLSFRSQGAVHHSRMNHFKGNFSFASPESSLSSPSVQDLVQNGVTYCRHHPFLYCLNPLSSGTSPVPVRLLFPLNRTVSPSSLKSLCHSVILRLVPEKGED